MLVIARLGKGTALIEFSNVTPRTIQSHFDMATLFYRWMWGPDLHHGLWEADESPREAQLQLTRRLSEMSAIQPRDNVLDVGCGLGAASNWLAKHKACDVTAVTNSPLQKRWASTATMFRRSQHSPRYICQDVEKSEFQPETFDVVWSIECIEHLFNKPEFFKRATRWLKPGGRMAICSFLAGADDASDGNVELVRNIFDGMGIPSIATQREYEQWLSSAGLKVTESQLLTEKVQRTWEVCKGRLDRGWVRCLTKPFGNQHRLALKKLDAILKAYRTGAMEYGCFIAEKPG